MFTTLNTGIVLWLVYGLMLNSLPLILANAVTLGLIGTFMILKLMGNRPK